MLIVLLFLFSLSFFSFPANAAFEISNQSPLISLFGSPTPVNNRHLSDNISVHYHLSSHFVARQSGDELLILDGETGRLELGFTRSLMPDWSYEIVLPLVSISGGFLDSAVNDWHKTFNLPHAGREDAEKKRLIYYYQTGNKVHFDVTDDVAGVGDLRLSVLHVLDSPADKQSIFRFGIKLPTGDEEKLLGSGGVDGFVDYTWLDRKLSKHWSYDASIGMLFMQKSTLFEQQKKAALFTNISATWQLSDAVQVLLQTSIHSSYFDSEIRVLDIPAVQIAGGLTYQMTKDWSIWGGITEDIVVATSPDVVFHFGVDYLLGRDARN